MKVGLDDFFAAGHTVADLLALAEDDLRLPDPGPPVATRSPTHLTESGNAERLVGQYGGQLRFCHPWGAWLVWDGRRWQRDQAATVLRWAKEVVRGIYHEAAAAATPELRQAHAAWAVKSESAAARAAMVRLAESEPTIPILPDALDVDPFLFNVMNGTLDLRTGRLRPHRPTDQITKLAPITFDPRARCPTFDTFLARILPDPDVRVFLQRYLGYALSGDTREQCLAFLYGSGANGKSTLLTLVRTLLGDYAKLAPPELLLARRGERHPTELADLFGARLVTSVEVDEGKRLAETLVKQMTGGDPMKGRFMRADFFEWMPTHKLLLAANHRPEIRGTDAAIWRRIHLVPFTVTIPADEQDTTLLTKLLAEGSGVLNWLLAGCLAWQRDGLGVPRVVRDATAAYRAEQDILADFVAERCALDSGVWTTSRNLYRAYGAWTEQDGLKPLSTTAFGRRLTERGCRSDKGANGVRIWRGIRLLDPNDVPPPERVAGSGEVAGSGATSDMNVYTGPDRAVMPKTAPQPATQANVPPELKAEAVSTTAFSYVTTAEHLAEAVRLLLVAEAIGLDCETAIADDGQPFDVKGNTSALDPRRGRLRLVQLSTTTGTYIVDVFRVPDLTPLIPLFASQTEFVLHHASFDLGWLRAAGLPLPEHVADTQILAQLHDAGRTWPIKKPPRLAELVQQYLGKVLDKSEQLGDWSVLELAPEQLAYAARDAEILLPLRDALQTAIAADGLEATAQLESNLLPFMAALEATGMLVDAGRWEELAAEARLRRDALEPELRASLGHPLNPKDGLPINLRSGDQLGAALAAVGVQLPRTEKGKIATAEKILAQCARQHPAIVKLLAWRHADTLSKFNRSWLRLSTDGRAHASFHQIGTETGRMSCSQPNLQQTPNHPAYRACFTAPPGRTLVWADLAGAQVCCAAELSGDEKLIAALNDGRDVHALTAAALFDVPVATITKESPERKLGKTIVFGTLFGQGVKGLLEQAAKQGLALTEREARTFLTRFDEAWPQLATWRRTQMRRSEPEIRSPLGRVRYVQSDVRGTIRANSPIQMLEAEGVKYGIARLWAARHECPSATPANFVHDELVYEVDDAEAPKLATLIRSCLQEGMAQVLSKVTVRVEVKMGTSWAGETRA